MRLSKGNISLKRQSISPGTTAATYDVSRNTSRGPNQPPSTYLTSDLSLKPHVIYIPEPVDNVVDSHPNLHTLGRWVFKDVDCTVHVTKDDHPELPNGHGIALPAARECTKTHPAVARRYHPESAARRLVGPAG